MVWLFRGLPACSRRQTIATIRDSYTEKKKLAKILTSKIKQAKKIANICIEKTGDRLWFEILPAHNRKFDFISEFSKRYPLVGDPLLSNY